MSRETLCATFQRTCAADPDAPALRAHGEDSRWTRGDYAAAVEEIAGGLASLGVRRGDTVGLMLTNSPEFHLVDTAALHLGATPFSIYNTSSPEQIAYLLGHAGNRVMVCEEQFAHRVRAADVPTLEHLVVVGGDGPLSLEDLRTRTQPDFDFEATWQAVQPDDVATLIYTSGTTGPPKGVELTHDNLAFVLASCAERYPFPEQGRCVSYLPTAHMADRAFSHYLQMATGWEITTVRDAKQVFAALGECHPSWFLGVPRIWEKLRAALLAKLSASPPATAALEASIARVQAVQRGEKLSEADVAAGEAADAAVFAPMRAQLGLDQVVLLMTGAAPIAAAVHEFYLALGLPLAEGFGMSETGALGLTNEPDDIRVGSVGRPMPGTEASLAEDGELLLRGAHVMRGYRHDPARTAEAIDDEGWLHTGDIATQDAEGLFRIVDRKKELIINAAGKNMSPVNIESALKSASPLIGQAICIGDARPYNVALLVLDADTVGALGFDSVSAAATDPGVVESVARAVESANATLSRIEQVKRYTLLHEEWLPDGDELTPTLKLKRRGIADAYATRIEELYA